MNTITKIACRSAGALGAGLALYDATQLGKLYSKSYSEMEQGKYLQNAYFNGRTIDNPSFIDNDIRATGFELRAKNPIPAFWGSIKGAISGSLYALANQLPTVACSTLAILGKGLSAKVGAIGVVVFQGYNAARNIFGLGKHNPMN